MSRSRSMWWKSRMGSDAPWCIWAISSRIFVSSYFYNKLSSLKSFNIKIAINEAPQKIRRKRIIIRETANKWASKFIWSWHGWSWFQRYWWLSQKLLKRKENLKVWSWNSKQSQLIKKSILSAWVSRHCHFLPL